MSGRYVGSPYLLPYGYLPYYPGGVPESTPAAGAELSNGSPGVAEGYLNLRVEPRTADVYFDGTYVGVVDDFGGTVQRLLPAGAHRVEITSPGYAGITVDVRIPENDTVTFTHDLERLPERPPVPPAAAATIPHKPTYVVPRCYIGDTPPRAVDLPAGCDLSKLHVIP